MPSAVAYFVSEKLDRYRPVRFPQSLPRPGDLGPRTCGLELRDKRPVQNVEPLAPRTGADQHLDRSGRECGSQPVERFDEARQGGIGLGQPIEPWQIEVEAEKLTDFAQHGVGRCAGPRADDAHEQLRIVDRSLPAHLVRHESVLPTRDPAEHVSAQTVHGILTPDAVAGERGAWVERSVGGENDIHRIITRASSVSELV